MILMMIVFKVHVFCNFQIFQIRIEFRDGQPRPKFSRSAALSRSNVAGGLMIVDLLP